MKYKTKKRNMQNNELMVKEEGVAYMTNIKPKTFSTEKCVKAIEWARINRALQAKFGNVDEEKILEEMFEEIHNPNIEYLDGAEVFAKIRRMIDEW